MSGFTDAPYSGAFTCSDDPDTLFFMRAFPDLESRERMKARFHEGDLWKNRLEALLMLMLDKSDVVRRAENPAERFTRVCGIHAPGTLSSGSVRVVEASRRA